MPLVACPRCGEDEDLTGTRDGETILLTCGSCRQTWDRDAAAAGTQPGPAGAAALVGIVVAAGRP
jgi:hypothetical protein